jgi:ribosome-binding protein aMBF1 (putative translation factor)
MPDVGKSSQKMQEARAKRRASSFVGYNQQSVTFRFGMALKDKRRALGLTQSDLAKITGMNRSFISEVESGHENISLERAEKLAKAVECTLAELIKE